MKKLLICLAFLLAFNVYAIEVCDMNEQGSILVYPLIDNINYNTIIEVTNRANTDVWLQGFMIVHPPGDPTYFEKKDFFIHLTQKEVFWWATKAAYNRVDVDGIRTQIQGFNNRKGFMFLWAVNDDKDKLEIDWDFLKGDCLIYNGGNGRAFQYNALPHQGLNVFGDRVLNLNGIEYCAATSQVMVEGFAEGFSGINGTWAVCSLDIDFINSLQPDFDINISVWNQYEVNQSRHLDFYQFVQYDLTNDLQLHIGAIFTPKWQFAATATGIDYQGVSRTMPVWSVFFQWVGNLAWGSNVWNHPATPAVATVVLPPVPQQK